MYHTKKKTTPKHISKLIYKRKDFESIDKVVSDNQDKYILTIVDDMCT